MAQQPASRDVFVDFLKRYRHDSSLFVREVFGVVLDDWQLEIMREYDARKALERGG